MASSDYISREAAESALKQPVTMSMCLTLEECKQKNAQRQIDLFVIRGLPATDVRPVRRGKWIEHNYDPEYLSCDFSCSECNVYLEEYYFGEGTWPGKTDHYFCPNCGADMRGESDV